MLSQKKGVIDRIIHLIRYLTKQLLHHVSQNLADDFKLARDPLLEISGILFFYDKLPLILVRFL